MSAAAKKRTCAEHRTQALDFVLGDLPPLEHARIAAHLENCADCEQLTARLSRAFSAAKSWPPPAEKNELEQMIARLDPYLPATPEPARFSFTFATSVFAAAAVAAGVVYLSTYTKVQVIEEPLTIAELATPEKIIIEPETPKLSPTTPEIVRLKPRPFVRVVAGDSWDGKIAGDSPESTSIVMSRGFAVIDFDGAAGRKLWVGAPNVSIEVVGTRFFVDTAPSGLTTIGVISGKVTVRHQDQQLSIHAGQRRSFGGQPKAALSTAENYVKDPFLARASREPVMARADHEPAELAAVAEIKPTNPLLELSSAQRLSRENRHRDALAKYDALLSSLDATSPLRGLARYERARLLSFQLDELHRGTDELQQLAAGNFGEATVQAKLSLCELSLATDRCAAKLCLDQLRVREHGALTAEIDRLFSKWNLSVAESCDHK